MEETVWILIRKEHSVWSQLSKRRSVSALVARSGCTDLNRKLTANTKNWHSSRSFVLCLCEKKYFHSWRKTGKPAPDSVIVPGSHESSWSVGLPCLRSRQPCCCAAWQMRCLCVWVYSSFTFYIGLSSYASIHESWTVDQSYLYCRLTPPLIQNAEMNVEHFCHQLTNSDSTEQTGPDILRFQFVPI